MKVRVGFVRAEDVSATQVKRRVKMRDDNRCVECGARRRLTIHHIRPIAAGGAVLDMKNMVTLCDPCHRKKHRVVA